MLSFPPLLFTIDIKVNPSQCDICLCFLKAQGEMCFWDKKDGDFRSLGLLMGDQFIG